MIECGQSKGKRPPLCPKSPKASTIQLERPLLSQLSRAKKNQRASHPLPPTPNTNHPPPQGQPPFPRPRPTAPVSSHAYKDEVRESEYRQYSRKTYLRRISQKGESDLTDKVSGRHLSSDNSSQYKSKSALEYAKYFIKQISNSPTDNSEQNQISNGEGIHPNEENINPNEQNLQLPQQALIQRSNSYHRQINSERETSRQKHRNSIMEKLKTLKSYRSKSKSNQQRSVQRQLLPSIDKRSMEKSNPKRSSQKSKKEGSIKSINKTGSQTLIGRLRNRQRNRKVILKARMIHQVTPEPLDQSMNLLISSFMDRSQSERTETSQKIQLFLQVLNLLPSYVKQFKQIYQEVECWDQLIFLTYKKFYLERLKVLQSLENISASYSPFRFPFSQISVIELRNFNPSIQGLRMQEKVREENKKIQNALRQLYNHIIEKSGRFINLLQQDNFSEQIYELMGEEVRLLGEGEEVSPARRNRMALTIKCCYVIACLNGQEVDLEEVLTDTELKNEHLTKFQNFLNSMLQ